MKLWSVLVLSVFLNFLALPSIAIGMDWDLPQSAIVSAEEENHAPGFQFAEKSLPKTLNVYDFIKFLPKENTKIFVIESVNKIIPPHISIISPPPEA